MHTDGYTPPYAITPVILHLVEEIGEALGQIKMTSEVASAPRLRRENRIQTIQASLAIEGNTLSLAQVTDIIEGKRVLGHPREIQEVRNALLAYEEMQNWDPHSLNDLLAAHETLMGGLVGGVGRFRAGSVGIQRGKEVVHIAPPAGRVEHLMRDLIRWLEETDEHPLVTSCVFHYEFEFIHPFEDGNGRMGRLWQTLILSRWRPVLGLLPVETVVRDRQSDYYAALRHADTEGKATSFVEFMLAAILQATTEATDHVTDQVTDQVRKLLGILHSGPKSAMEGMALLQLSHRPTFRNNYLHPAIAQGLVEMTLPDTPRARNQKYRLTSAGRRVQHSS